MFKHPGKGRERKNMLHLPTICAIFQCPRREGKGRGCLVKGSFFPCKSATAVASTGATPKAQPVRITLRR